MRHRAFRLSAVGLLLVTTLALGTTSIVDAAKKPPSAKAQLKKAFRQLLKTRNYTVNTKVLGGLAKSAEHKVVEVTVNETYGGTVFGSSKRRTMRIPSIKAYKQPKAGHGVIDRDGLWARILTTKDGVKMDRLVDFPALILAEAMRYSKTARWLTDEEVAASAKPQETLGFDVGLDDRTDKEAKDKERSDAAPTEEPGDAKKKGRTTSVKKSRKKKSAPVTPRFLRVTAAPKQALDIWIKRVENSGCMKDG